MPAQLHDEASVAAYGQTTGLELDANGYLKTITNPANKSYGFTYTSDGLMLSMRDPKRHDPIHPHNYVQQYITGAGKRIVTTSREGRQKTETLDPQGRQTELGCDHGQRYCRDGCAGQARSDSLRRIGIFNVTASW